MTTMLERVPVDRITAEAEQMRRRTGPALISLIGFPFWLLGQIIFWVVIGLNKGAFWCVASVKIGYVEARERAADRGVTMPVWSTPGQAEDGMSLGTR